MDGEMCDIDVLCNFINSSMVSATSYQKLIYSASLKPRYGAVAFIWIRFYHDLIPLLLGLYNVTVAYSHFIPPFFRKRVYPDRSIGGAVSTRSFGSRSRGPASMAAALRRRR